MKLDTVNGWLLLADPLFEDSLASLENEVTRLAEANPSSYKTSKAAKRLAAISRLIVEVIPSNPAAAEFRLGKTLPTEFKHWRRAKFLQQYRLFFRYDSSAKIIIYSWINDQSTLRAYESKNDAYRTFVKMLESGRPPTTWTDLLASAELH